MFHLNAWFERSAPYMELRNNYTGKVLISLQGEHLHTFLDDCGLVYSDLIDDSKLSETIKTLLLATIKDDLCVKPLSKNSMNNIFFFQI